MAIASEQPRDRDEAVLVPKEVAVLLKVHEQTVYLWRKRGEGPPYVRIGRKCLYSRSTVLAWFHRQQQGGECA